jgi:hypothetical protein
VRYENAKKKSFSPFHSQSFSLWLTHIYYKIRRKNKQMGKVYAVPSYHISIIWSINFIFLTHTSLSCYKWNREKCEKKFLWGKLSLISFFTITLSLSHTLSLPRQHKVAKRGKKQTFFWSFLSIIFFFSNKVLCVTGKNK